MIMGFSDKFVAFVLDGSKTHSIRRGNRWRAGMRVDAYRRPRQQGMELLLRAPCVKVQTISIWLRTQRPKVLVPDEPVYVATLGISIDGNVLTDDEVETFAWRDGFRATPTGLPFEAINQMVQFWRLTHALDDSGAVFEGQLIHWDYRLAIRPPAALTARGKEMHAPAGGWVQERPCPAK